ncbi:MAG TPA: ribosome small subunit-dependent GTPase A [Motilibacteraceae bacterium]|nr:ribosome small subunit-dependent GTPase A [Motilibacteraceae bacterium]
MDRGRFRVLVEADGTGGSGAGETTEITEITAMKARELGRKGVVVGDRVGVVGDLAGGPDSLARIVRVEPRTSVLRRTADDTDPVERVLVANADRLAVVMALADPEPQPRLLDRCLVAAYDAGLEPLLVLTKADLADPEPFLRAYAALDVPHVVTSRLEDPGGRHLELGPLRERLATGTTVLVGSSGVGKSTLVNALVPGAGRSTGEVNAVTGRGRHTSTSALLLPLPGGGEVSDTPGVRSFGLAHVDPARVLRAFPDLEAGTAECPRSCSHDEPECALDDWVAAGHADPARLESLRRLLRAREPQAGD